MECMCDWIYETSFTAGMNQQYAQYMTTVWDFVAIAVGVAWCVAVVGTVCTFLSMYEKVCCGSAIAVFGLVFVFIAVVLHRGETAKNYHKWCDVRFSVDSLDGSATREQVHEIRTMIHEIEKHESAPIRSVLDWCYKCECQRRGVEAPPM